MEKIAVDFDGTCVDHQYPDIGPDAPHCVDVLGHLSQRGHKIFLFTMRCGRELEAAVGWFRERGIFLSGIQCDPGQTWWTASSKCYANLYIDDAAFGCPLVHPEGFHRPCVDWIEVARHYRLELVPTNLKGGDCTESCEPAPGYPCDVCGHEFPEGADSGIKA